MNRQLRKASRPALGRRGVAYLALIGVALLPSLPTFGQSTFTEVTTGPIATEGGWSNRDCWVDYDNDGFLDLFVASGSFFVDQAQQMNSFLSHNHGNTNRWLKVKLVDTVSNFQQAD